MSSFRPLAVAILILLALGLGGCALTALNAVTPDGSYELREGLAYGPHERHRLDLALPRDGPPRGLVLFFYGGAWTRGDRADFHFVIGPFTRAGYAVAIPDYRLYPEVRFPAFVEDGALALAWLLEEAPGYGVPVRPLLLAGHSAGAHLAALLTFDERYRQARGIDHDPVTAFAGLAGPYDFLPLTSPLLKSIFAPPQQYPQSQPVNFVDGDEAPTLLIHGDADREAWPRNSRRLAARIRENGGWVEESYLPGVGHRRVALALSPTFYGLAPVAETTLDFFQRVIQETSASTVAGN